jgi:hypothetical protein
MQDFPNEAPPLRELRGIGDIVHDFHTGIERSFERIAPDFGGISEGRAWHRYLLELPIASRTATTKATRSPTWFTRTSHTTALSMLEYP